MLPASCTSQGAERNGLGLPSYISYRGDLHNEVSRPDQRGKVAGIWSIEVSEMGGSLGSCTPFQLGTFSNDSLQATHLGWDRNNWAGDSTTQWGAVKDWVSDPANALDNTACPTVYDGGCVTGSR